MPPHDFEPADWVRLGRVVYNARRRRGYVDTVQWAARVGRSTRVVLGLERGEPAGRATLALVETALDWPDQHAYRVLESADVADVLVTQTGAEPFGAPETVSGPREALADSRFRRPEGMGDDEWERYLDMAAGYLAALLDQAETER